jgi:hypothetical protein
VEAGKASGAAEGADHEQRRRFIQKSEGAGNPHFARTALKTMGNSASSKESHEERADHHERDDNDSGSDQIKHLVHHRTSYDGILPFLVLQVDLGNAA